MEMHIVVVLRSTAILLLAASLTVPAAAATAKKGKGTHGAIALNRDSKAVVAKFDLRAAGRNGRLQLIVPQAAIRASRVQPTTDPEEQDEGSPDLLWFRQMQSEVKSTAVKVTAVLPEMGGATATMELQK